MGLVRAAVGAIGGTLGDQWKDFYTVPSWVSGTTAIFPAQKQGTDNSRGSNKFGSRAIITNGSKFVVPEGYGLILMQDGAFTGFISEPGAYIWDTEALDSKSIFADDGFIAPLIKNSWERFKFGGKPQSEQMAIFVSLQELSNNKFGSASEIYWDDKYLNAQVGAIVRGSYTLRILDPLLFVNKFVPTKYLQQGEAFDFTDLDNAASQQLFNEVVASLAGAFSIYLNAPDKQNRMTQIQQDSIGFGKSLSSVVDSSYQWKEQRGIEIVKTAIVSIEYDESTKALLKTAQRADALSGNRGNSNLQASVAAGIEAAGSAEGSAGILGIGLAGGSIGLNNLQQESQPSSADVSESNSPIEKLQQLKEMLDAGLITQTDYDLAKNKILDL